jgi:hypothetical protein
MIFTLYHESHDIRQLSIKFQFSMSPDKLYSNIVPPFCLEEGQRYQVTISHDFIIEMLF